MELGEGRQRSKVKKSGKMSGQGNEEMMCCSYPAHMRLLIRLHKKEKGTKLKKERLMMMIKGSWMV